MPLPLSSTWTTACSGSATTRSPTRPMTHDFLAQMLAARRATISTAAGVLRRAGVIRYGRGRMAVVDRSGLERAACECYRLLNEEYAELLP
jgi:hypothetical protein